MRNARLVDISGIVQVEVSGRWVSVWMHQQGQFKPNQGYINRARGLRCRLCAQARLIAQRVQAFFHGVPALLDCVVEGVQLACDRGGGDVVGSQQQAIRGMLSAEQLGTGVFHFGPVGAHV